MTGPTSAAGGNRSPLAEDRPRRGGKAEADQAVCAGGHPIGSTQRTNRPLRGMLRARPDKIDPPRLGRPTPPTRPALVEIANSPSRRPGERTR
jgi:hypothetical protein